MDIPQQNPNVGHDNPIEEEKNPVQFDEVKDDTDKLVAKVEAQLMTAIVKNKQTLENQLKLPNLTNSLNFIVKEYNSQYSYAGCVAEKNLYIIKPDETWAAYDIGKNALCGILCSESILALGALNGEILFYSLSNPEKPMLTKTLTMEEQYNMTCLTVIGPKFIFCGQERGFLSIVDFSKFAVVSQSKVEHKDSKSHINSITKTATKGFYVIGTNKGLCSVKINERNQNIMIQK